MFVHLFLKLRVLPLQMKDFFFAKQWYDNDFRKVQFVSLIVKNVIAKQCGGKKNFVGGWVFTTSLNRSLLTGSANYTYIHGLAFYCLMHCPW